MASVQEQRLPPTEPQINEDPPRSADVSVADKVSVIFFYFFITNCGPCRLIPTSHPTPCSHKKALHFSGLKITTNWNEMQLTKNIKKIPNRKKLNQQHLPYISLKKKKQLWFLHIRILTIVERLVKPYLLQLNHITNVYSWSWKHFSVTLFEFVKKRYFSFQTYSPPFFLSFGCLSLKVEQLQKF